jgi:hypothetical protein
MKALLYRIIVGMWALVIRITRGKLPDGVQVVPAENARPAGADIQPKTE